MNVERSTGKGFAASLQYRRRLGVRFAAIILAFYFGFSALLAFFPKFLALGAPISIGFALILIHLAAVVILNITYMNAAKSAGAGETSNRQ